MTDCQPFKIDFPEEVLKAIRKKVVDFPWHEMPEDGGWAYGTNLDYMKELANYWATEFDWKAREKLINQFPQFKAQVDGIDIHFVHKHFH